MRELILVRHAIAEDRDRAAREGVADADRRLTEKGAARMKQAARGLAAVMRAPAAVAHSPLRRARETAEILSRIMASVPLQEVPALAPDGPAEQLYDWLAQQPEGSSCIAVGHEPDLGRWTLGALAGRSASGAIPFRKGAAARLVFAAGCAPGEGELEWFLPPRVLRALG